MFPKPRSIRTICTVLTLVASSAQANSDTTQAFQNVTYTKAGQAKPEATQPLTQEAFGDSDTTTFYWLGLAGFMINSHGTTFMVDPLLEGFDMEVMIDFPIRSEDVPAPDAILVTHADNDHFSIPTLSKLNNLSTVMHSTQYVGSLMKQHEFNGAGHDIGDSFKINRNVNVKVMPADHAWQNAYPDAADRVFKDEDSAGFWIQTEEGTIWATGDSRLMPEQLTYSPAPDIILFDFSDSEWHFTFEGAVKLENAYPEAILLLHHWGSVNAPDFSPFNGDPNALLTRVTNPERIKVLAPGEPFVWPNKKQ
ncbi:MBL fold metallo-hydrolase [Alteromonas sp. 1_MG-2023]|uniref:MBL fold metallo-hydrolase n=1 Tax=Alteromonas sp. 1_MG-2023 TaxID=3062669 RepID=UPI0026E265F4|nr:MBL fold metallo-hydrolase [Alteromonas sp. 1_MG-2023]MDO6474506.1 MBL fold metallo-hydrolase [Alteromonas sp. 1_MG-2023]